MAQNQKSSNSEGVFKKIYKKFSFSTISHPNPPVQTIPSEFDRPAASVSSHKNKNILMFFLPKKLANRNEQRGTNKPRPDIAKAASRRDHFSPRGRFGNNNAVREAKPSLHVSAAKTESLKDDDKFSDYITKVKDKMKTVSNVGVAKTATTRRDSFNDKVSHFINRTKIKIRATTNVGIEEDASYE